MSVGDALKLHRSPSVLDFVLDIRRSWECLDFSIPSRTSVVIELGPLLYEVLLISLATIALHILVLADRQCVDDTDDGRPRTPRQERGRKRQRRCQAQSHQSRKRTNMILPALGISFLICFWLLADHYDQKRTMFRRLSGPYLELTHNVWALQESGGSAAFWVNLCGDLLIWLRVCDLSRWNKILTTFFVRALVAITRTIGGSPLIPNGELSLSGVAGNLTGSAQLDIAKFGVANAPLTLFTTAASTVSIATKLWYFPRALKKCIEVGSKASQLGLKKMVFVLVEFGVGSCLIWLATTSVLGTSQTASINRPTSGIST